MSLQPSLATGSAPLMSNLQPIGIEGQIHPEAGSAVRLVGECPNWGLGTLLASY
jgi:hypothetical protein